MQSRATLPTLLAGLALLAGCKDEQPQDKTIAGPTAMQ